MEGQEVFMDELEGQGVKGKEFSIGKLEGQEVSI